jgi:hypothetical protein
MPLPPPQAVAGAQELRQRRTEIRAGQPCGYSSGSTSAKLKVGVDPSAARQAERAERQIAEAEAALRETTFGSVADKWLKTRVPVKAKRMEEKEIKKRFKTYARDDRMVGYIKDGKETAPGFGRVVINRVELGHLSPILKAVNHPTRIRLISTARKIISLCQGARPLAQRPPLAVRRYRFRRWLCEASGDASASDHRSRQIRPASPEDRSL